MIHQMGLYKRPFRSIQSGKKTVEVRLYDGKRRGIKSGISSNL
ncbi:ASC-1-like (ASCH) protein [Saccharococcus thermophilus]|uniref:ASC-1-like (ASCH) protein n=1 Tax=Saccharococcus thermophilus TaxID=29396 RepID=A0A846MCZ7_9BACL|nr:ASC-1-like (ASCH) protein [Saccharococcus thermophilus]